MHADIETVDHEIVDYHVIDVVVQEDAPTTFVFARGTQEFHVLQYVTLLVIGIASILQSEAMAGFIDFIKKGRFKSTDTVIFVHTGGIPALFAYDKEIAG